MHSYLKTNCLETFFARTALFFSWEVMLICVFKLEKRRWIYRHLAQEALGWKFLEEALEFVLSRNYTPFGRIFIHSYLSRSIWFMFPEDFGIFLAFN